MRDEKTISKPAYLIAKGKVIDLIINEKYNVGEMLPSRNQLSEMFLLGKISIQKAMNMLADEGILENIRGSGCYVKTIPKKPSDADVTNEDLSIISDDLLTGISFKKNSKVIRIAVSICELEYFSKSWKEIFLEFQKQNDIKVEIVRLTNLNDLIKKLPDNYADIYQVPAGMVRNFVDCNYLFPPGTAGEFDLSGDKFYKAFDDAVKYRGVFWGVPFITSNHCVFYNCKYQKFIDEIRDVKGFWNFLGTMERYMGKVTGAESLIANNHPIQELYFATVRERSQNENESGVFNNADYRRFVEKFGCYYTNNRIFHSGVGVGSTDSVIKLLNGQVPIAFGSGSWIHFFRQNNCSWGAIENPLEKNSVSKTDATVNVISNYTLFPTECLEVLNYLKRFETQKFFAENGRTVAREDANQFFKIKNLDDASIDALVNSFRKSVVRVVGDYFSNDSINAIVRSEMTKWISGDYTSRDFIEQVSMKIKFFYRGLELRSKLNNNGDRNGTRDDLKITPIFEAV